MNIQGRYCNYKDITTELNDDQELSYLIEKNEPSFCYTCSKLINSDIDTDIFKDEGTGQTYLIHRVFVTFEKLDDDTPTDLISERIKFYEINASESISLCHSCSENVDFELKEIFSI